MTTDKILYPNAYKNLHAYYANIGYWTKKIELILRDTQSLEYSYKVAHNVQNTVGVPICGYTNKDSHRGIYVYQYSTIEDYSPNLYHRYFTAWIKKIDGYQFLVIYLLCTRDNVAQALKLIKLWVCKRDRELNNEINEIYSKHENEI